MNGFVLLARKIQDNSIWRRDPDHLKLFLYLLLNANYREDKVYKYYSGDESVEVGYAQYLCSYSKISADCQYSAGNKLISWQPSRVNRMLKALEADGRIRVVGKTQMGTLVEVCNYKLFQDVSTYRLTPTSPAETRGLEDPVKTTGSKVNSDINKEIQQLWDVYLIYRDAFKGILKAVKSSEHHMKERAWQLPESLFRNEERRERWAMKGQEKRHQPKAHGVSRNQWSVEA